MNVDVDERGYEYVSFQDDNGQACTLKQSSAIDMNSGWSGTPGASKLWLGVSGTRMHLNRKQVKQLIRLMKQWVKTGCLEPIDARGE